MNVSPQRRLEILDALRRGTVPSQGLDVLAVGLDRFAAVIDDELDMASSGHGVFKAVRGEYGAGKTFFTRWLAERAKSQGLAASEVQISESDTPLHRYQTVYRRLVEQLATSAMRGGALRSVVDNWFFTLEEQVLATGTVDEQNTELLTVRTAELMEQRLGDITRTAPAFSAVLRAYLTATNTGDHATADGLLAWLGGQPHVAASVKRAAGIKGDLDHDAALSFLAGLLAVLRDAGYKGLVVVLDEVETMQRMRGDVRDKGLEALRKAHRRSLRPAVPRLVPGDHRHPGVLRRTSRSATPRSVGPAVAHRFLHRGAVRQPPRRADPPPRLRHRFAGEPRPPGARPVR